MSKITPTIGRKLYFYPNGMPTRTMNDQDSPLDATIVYVWPSTAQVGPGFSLNLYVIDHAGVPIAVHGIPLIQDGEDAPAAPQPYAQWMPFQVGQAKAQETEKAPEAGNVAAAPNAADGAAIATTSAAASTPTSDQVTEAEIQAKNLNGPRITPTDIEAAIDRAFYFTAAQGAEKAARDAGSYAAGEPHHGKALGLLTFCVLVLRNGFTVTGESACVSPENFDVEIGRKVARQNAVQKIWPLMGYALKEKLNAA